MYALRVLAALLQRAWLKLYHRLEICGAERLPVGQSFVIVANHQSHLDAPSLAAAIPMKWLHRAFPAAAADYFFKSTPKSVFYSVVFNALPFERKSKGAQSLAVCRELLQNKGNILIIFPEGAALPRPRKLVLHIGEPKSYGNMSPGWDTVEYIANDLRKIVAALGKAKV